MWGKTRPSGVYYQCQVTYQRAISMPADHPATVHVSEAKLNAAVLEFLGSAVLGPEREAYWRYCLTAANHSETTSPNDARIQELEITDLEARLALQVADLEDEETTPAVRKRVAQRIAELDNALVEKRRLRDQPAAHAPAPAPKIADVADYWRSYP
jgi:hypothetical protein